MLHFKPFKEFESVITGHSSQEVSDKNWFVSFLYLPKEEVTDGFWKDQIEYLLQKFSEPADDYWLLYSTLFLLVKLYLPKEEVTGGLWKDQLEYLLQKLSETADDYWLLYSTIILLVKLYLPKEEVTVPTRICFAKFSEPADGFSIRKMVWPRRKIFLRGQFCIDYPELSHRLSFPNILLLFQYC